MGNEGMFRNFQHHVATATEIYKMMLVTFHCYINGETNQAHEEEK